MSIEKSTGIAALYFNPSRTLNLLHLLSPPAAPADNNNSSNTKSNNPPGTSTATTTTATTSTAATSTTTNTATVGTVHTSTNNSSSSTSKVVNLIDDSQSPSQSKSPAGAGVVDCDCQIINCISAPHSSISVVDITGTGTGTSTAGGGKGSKSRTKGNALGSRTLSNQFLSKEQVAQLKSKCSAENSGLSVKSIVACQYTATWDDVYCGGVNTPAGNHNKYSTHSTYSEVQVLTQLDSLLQQEIRWIRAQKLKELMQSDAQAAEKLNEEIATAEGSLMECGCCYGEYAFESLVQCTEGHLFCKSCLQRYAEQTVFGEFSLHCICFLFCLK